jgi:hypothetical protein
LNNILKLGGTGIASPARRHAFLIGTHGIDYFGNGNLVAIGGLAARVRVGVDS